MYTSEPREKYKGAKAIKYILYIILFFNLKTMGIISVMGKTPSPPPPRIAYGDGKIIFLSALISKQVVDFKHPAGKKTR